MIRTIGLATVAALALAACRDQASAEAAGARDQIRIVGSSTVYPFTTSVAEQFVNTHAGVKAPVIESTGTGGGIKLFCAGIGARHPDIADASRRIRSSEYGQCEGNGVGPVLEVQIGIDGIAFAASKAGPHFPLTAVELYRALSAEVGGRPNPNRSWRDVDPQLPAVPIQVYGPPATSGTRDAFAELILARGCLADDRGATALQARDPAAFARRCTTIRQDGAYIDAGENDNLIVQKLQSNSNAIGIFGYSYLQENGDRLDGLSVEGVAPSYAAIASGRYPAARPLYIYVKKAHLDAVSGLRPFLDTYAALWGPDGPLVKRGLIAAPPAIRARSAAIISGAIPLDPATLR